MESTLWRLPAIKSETGLSRSTLYARAKSQLFTPPVVLGARAVAWPKREVEALNEARIAGKSDDEIRELVKKLVADRSRAA
jgi:prophage regulatory protein